MKWISKDPPIYVWPGDTWLNEKENKIYHADLRLNAWIYKNEYGGSHSIPFPTKTRILKDKL